MRRFVVEPVDWIGRVPLVGISTVSTTCASDAQRGASAILFGVAVFGVRASLLVVVVVVVVVFVIVVTVQTPTGQFDARSAFVPSV